MILFRKLYNYTLEKASHKNAKFFLNLVAFIESSFFPIPPDILLIPMILAKRAHAWFYAFSCTISSVLGAVLGYIIGYFFYNSIGIFIIEFYDLVDLFRLFEGYYTKYGVLIVLGAGFTPFPFKFITIASGMFSLNILLFITVAFFARGLRFFLIAGLLYIFGNLIKNFIDKYFNILLGIFFLLLIIIILMVKLI